MKYTNKSSLKSINKILNYILKILIKKKNSLFLENSLKKIKIYIEIAKKKLKS
jgi:hypothetical protein